MSILDKLCVRRTTSLPDQFSAKLFPLISKSSFPATNQTDSDWIASLPRHRLSPHINEMIVNQPFKANDLSKSGKKKNTPSTQFWLLNLTIATPSIIQRFCHQIHIGSVSAWNTQLYSITADRKKFGTPDLLQQSINDPELFLTFAHSTFGETKRSERRPHVDFTTWQRCQSDLRWPLYWERSGAIKHLLALIARGVSRRRGRGVLPRKFLSSREPSASEPPVSCSHRSTYCVPEEDELLGGAFFFFFLFS